MTASSPLMADGSPPDEVVQVRVLIRHEADRTYIEADYDDLAFCAVSDHLLSTVVVSQLRAGQMRGMVGRLLVRKETDMDDRYGLAIQWEKMAKDRLLTTTSPEETTRLKQDGHDI